MRLIARAVAVAAVSPRCKHSDPPASWYRYHRDIRYLVTDTSGGVPDAGRASVNAAPN